MAYIIDPQEREIEKRTYGKELRQPIHDAIYLLSLYNGDPRPIVLMTRDEYDEIDVPNPEYDYAIIYEG